MFTLIGFWWTTVYKFYLFTSCLSTFVEHYSQTGKDPRPMLLNTCHTNNTIMIVVAMADKDMQPAHNYEYKDDQNLWPRSQDQNLLTKIQRSILTKIIQDVDKLQIFNLPRDSLWLICIEGESQDHHHHYHHHHYPYLCPYYHFHPPLQVLVSKCFSDVIVPIPLG